MASIAPPEDPCIAAVVLLVSALTLRMVAVELVRRCLEAASLQASTSIFEKLFALSVLQKLIPVSVPPPCVREKEKEASDDALSPGLSPTDTELESSLPPPAYDEHSENDTCVHITERPLPSPPTGLKRMHGSWLKFTNRCRQLTHLFHATHLLNLNDAGAFDFDEIELTTKDSAPLQLHLESRSGRYTHFAFAQRRENRAVAKLLSFIETDQCKKVRDLRGFPLCEHFNKRELLKVVTKLGKNATARLDENPKAVPLEQRPAVKTQILRCSYCPSEYRLSVSLRRLSVQFGHSAVPKRVAPHFEWAQESSDVHVLLERWVDLGLCHSPAEDNWRSLVDGGRHVRGKRVGKRKWLWSQEHRERARMLMEGDDEVPVWKVKDML